jgi:tetratricopeptide (TPR) repeat protein
VSYFPYLRLGIAYYHLGQLEAAVQAFATEEQLGAIRESPADLAQLERYRLLTREAKQRAESELEARVRRIVGEARQEAEQLAGQGRLEDAVAALARALAVAPDDPGALARMESLRGEIGKRDRARRDAEQGAELLTRGRALLAEGKAGQAAGVLRQALELGPSPEAERLLDRAQAALRTEAEGRRTADRVDETLAEVRRLEAAGRVEEALAGLQPLLALDLPDPAATELLDRLLAEGRERTRRASLDAAVAEAKSELAAGRFERAIAAANRALAEDSANPAALEQLGQAYRAINRRLLGGAGNNLPPAIRFADLRQEQADGSRLERVTRREFRLAGVVVDASEVEVQALDDRGRRLEPTCSTQAAGEVQVTSFSLACRLDPGRTVLRVSAADDLGSTSSSEYVVVYRPPLYRSPWFVPALAAIAIGATATVVVARSRRRRRLRRRRFNPYVAGAPVLDRRLFFGREALLDRVLQTIHNNSLLLHGERRIGKTSLQHHLKRRLEQLEDPEYRFFPVYVDLQGTPGDRFFATLAEEVMQELAPHLEGLDAELPRPADPGFGYRELVLTLRAVLDRLERASPKRVKLVLLIDEVDELNHYDPRVNQRLRSLFMKSFADRLVAVVSGVAIRREWGKEASPWYNFFEEIEVGALTREDAAELVTRPLEGVFRVGPGAVDRILDLTDCRPYLIQRLGVAVVNRLHEQGRRTITVADVDAIGRPEER